MILRLWSFCFIFILPATWGLQYLAHWIPCSFWSFWLHIVALSFKRNCTLDSVNSISVNRICFLLRVIILGTVLSWPHFLLSYSCIVLLPLTYICIPTRRKTELIPSLQIQLSDNGSQSSPCNFCSVKQSSFIISPHTIQSFCVFTTLNLFCSSHSSLSTSYGMWFWEYNESG